MQEKKTRGRRVVFVTMLVMATAVCVPTAHAKQIKAFVSIVPQKYFVQKIGGNLIDVSVMVPPGSNPATYEPKPQQMAALSKATIYFAVGVPFEKIWLKKIAAANPDMLVVHTEEGIEKSPMKGPLGSESDRLPEGGKSQRMIRDPHIWLSPPLVMIQARNILTSLRRVDSQTAPTYQANYKKFIMELVDLDLKLSEILADKKGMEFLVFHPSWGYFARAYGLKQVPIEREGKEPKPAGLGRLIKYAKQHGIKTIFAQPEFSTRSAEIIAKAIGGKVILASPLAPNWEGNLIQVATRFRAALR